MVLTNEEPMIRIYVDTLKTVYARILDFFNQKKEMKSSMQETSKVYFSRNSELQKLLNQEMTLLKKSIKASNNRDSVIIVYNAVIDRLISSYKGSLKMYQLLSNYTVDQKDLKKKNLVEIKTQQKNIKKASAFFNRWYRKTMDWEKLVYEKDKELSKQIQSESMRNRKLVQTKIEKYRLGK
jgi:hypothetical protein